MQKKEKKRKSSTLTMAKKNVTTRLTGGRSERNLLKMNANRSCLKTHYIGVNSLVHDEQHAITWGATLFPFMWPAPESLMDRQHNNRSH